MDHEVVKPKPTPVEDGYYLYHLTHIDNLPDILKYGLLSRNELLRCSAPFKDCKNREAMQFGEEYQRVLSDYVSFYLYGKNPFADVLNKTRGKDGFGPDKLVLIAIYRSAASSFSLIPHYPLDGGTPTILPFSALQDKAAGAPIDWNTLNNFKFADYSDPSVRSTCLAEAISDSPVPPSMFQRLYVANSDVERKVRDMGLPPHIKLSVLGNIFF